MKAGLLNQRIAVKRKSVVEGTYTDKEVWNEVFQTWASVEHDSGNREVQNKEIFYSDFVTFSIRDYHEVMDEDHIVWDGREYRIVNIFHNNESTYREIVLKTELVNK